MLIRKLQKDKYSIMTCMKIVTRNDSVQVFRNTYLYNRSTNIRKKMIQKKFRSVLTSEEG